MIHPDIVARVVMHRPRMAVSDLWLLMVRAQMRHTLGWLSEYLWKHRVASFLASDLATEHCINCGARFDAQRSDQRYCSDACKCKGYRLRKRGEKTAMESAISESCALMDEIAEDLTDWRKWYRLRQSTLVLPPDLLQIQHLPSLPGRCGQGCHRGVGCSHTDGSVCFFAGTMGGMDDE